MAANTRCRDVVVLDFSGLLPVCDFFVIATGTSPRQLRSVADELAELGKSRDFAPINPVHQDSSSWILVDCVDVVIHLFSEEGRQYYDLENLWGDAKRVDWNNPANPSSSQSK
ncbi:MAG TPA: ribosome silencing factor [Tepidisphaeraceae bacterium]|nr:ribosome silencing factor [Tepidisphaeraceae bacterium]